MTPHRTLFGITASQVTSKTRARWSAEDMAIFRGFVQQQRDNGASKTSQSTDITTLLDELQLSRFCAMDNTQGDKLGPIIDTKVRRKLQCVWQELGIVLPERTRLQAVRKQAAQEGKTPPERLPGPEAVYTPEPWPARRRRVSATKGGTKTPATIQEARRQVSRLTKALELAEAQLSKLELQQQHARADGVGVAEEEVGVAEEEVGVAEEEVGDAEEEEDDNNESDDDGGGDCDQDNADDQDDAAFKAQAETPEVRTITARRLKDPDSLSTRLASGQRSAVFPRQNPSTTTRAQPSKKSKPHAPVLQPAPSPDEWRNRAGKSATRAPQGPSHRQTKPIASSFSSSTAGRAVDTDNRPEMAREGKQKQQHNFRVWELDASDSDQEQTRRIEYLSNDLNSRYSR